MNKRRMAMSEKKGFFKRLAQGLSKTRDKMRIFMKSWKRF